MNPLKIIFLLSVFSYYTMSSIIRAQDSINLKEVTVIASRTINSAEGYITNLKGSEIVKGKPAIDVLSFLPNISRENGSFKINGLIVSEIYVDGIKLSDLSELDNIPAEMIDKVQVKYLAGADQSAGLSGGSIIITLIRPPEGGYYGSITANADWYHSCNFGNEGLGGIFNYRYKDLSIYDNLYLGGTKVEEKSEQWQTGPNLYSYLMETTKSNGFDFRNRLSLTQQFKSGAQLGGSYFITTNRTRPNSYSYMGDGQSVIEKRITSTVQEGTIKLMLPLNKKGSAIEITGDYLNRKHHENDYYSLDKDLIGSTLDKTDLNMWQLKADFLYPRSRKLSWKFGMSTQWINSTFSPDIIMETDKFNLSYIPSKTSGFTPIVYATVQGMLWKLRYSAGLNWQLNRIEYEVRFTDVKDHNTQWSINPVLQLMMPFGAKMEHALMLSYKRNLNDIPYTAISSVINWSDAYNYSIGNPNLKASSSDMIMAGLSLIRNKINITAVFARQHDRIFWQTFQSDSNPNVFYTKPINLSGQSMWGIGVEWIEKPVKWWKFKLSGRVEINPENITMDNIYYGKTRLKEFFFLNNNFVFPKGWGGMLNIDFEPTYKIFDRTYYGVYNVNGRIYKNFLKNNLQLALDFTPFGNRRKLERKAGENKITHKYSSPVQYLGFSLTWNFSGGKDVDVNVVDGIQEYYETKDNR